MKHNAIVVSPVDIDRWDGYWIRSSISQAKRNLIRHQRNLGLCEMRIFFNMPGSSTSLEWRAQDEDTLLLGRSDQKVLW